VSIATLILIEKQLQESFGGDEIAEGLPALGRRNGMEFPYLISIGPTVQRMP
jgi:hypothetical protein